MNSIVEERFVRTNIKTPFQERILFELLSKKHRKKALDRFSHNAENLLKPLYQIFGLNELFRSIKDETTYYVITPSDGIVVSAENAYNYCLKTYSSVIIIGEKLSFVKEEVEAGSPRVFLLK